MSRPLRSACVLLLGAVAPAASQETPPDSAQQLDTIAVVAGAPGAPPPNPLLLVTAVSTITAAAAAALPARILPDVLRELPGVQVQQTNAGHGTVILRGMTGNQVLVLIDGVRLNTATVRDGPSQYLATIDPERIERVEVIRGPGSVLYGSDAMGGVVNVVTRRPSARDAVAGSVAWSSADDGRRAHLEAGGGTARLRARVGVSVADVGLLRAGGAIGEQPFTDYSSVAASGDLALAASRCASAAAGVQGMTLRDVSRFDRLVRFRFDPLGQPGPDAQFLFDPQSHLLATVRYSARGCDGPVPTWGAVGGVQLQREGRLQRGREGGDADTLPAPTREYRRDDTHTTFTSAWLEPRLPSGTSLRLGADVYHDRVESRGYIETVASGAREPIVRMADGEAIAAGRFPDGARSTAIGGYAHAARILGARTRLLGGLRYDAVHVDLRAGDAFGGDIDSWSSTVSGQLGAVVFAGPATVSAHIGQGFRAANIYDLSTVSTVPGGIVLPSASLGPERSLTYEAAVRRSWRHGAVDLVGYRTDIDDFVDRVPGSYRGDTLFEGQRVFRAANLGQARIVGAELAVSATAGRWSMRAQSFWTRGWQRTPGGAREPVGRIPPLSGMAAVRRSSGGAAGRPGGWVELVGRAAGPQRRLSGRDRRDSRIAAAGTPEWRTLGLRAAVHGGRWSVVGGAENLFDEAYREHGSGIDAPGRYFWLRLELSARR